nr:hypothetical protein [Pseudodesulfovibrio indicus]
MAESIVEGKSSRVRESLREKFDLAMETDATKWKAIVTKRDSANRVARFHEDMDECLNHMIQAKDEASYAKAKAMWEGRMDAIQPYMSVGEFSRLREATADKVKFRRAWNGQTGEGEFDPSGYMDLSPEQVSQLEGRHYAMARERERLTAERQVDRMNTLLPRLEDSLSSAMEDGVPMDGTEDMLRELATLGERGAEASAKYRAQLGRAATAWSVMDSVKHRPFSEQLAAVEALRPEAGADGYRADMELYQRAGQHVQEKARAFQADPAGFVREEAERRARNAADPWVADDDLEPFVVRASLAVQRELGEREPKLMPTAQAKSVKAEYERADGDGKAQILQQVFTYGDNSRQALKELDLGLEHTFLAEMYMDDPILGRMALDIASMKASDIAVDPAVAKDIKKEIDDAYYAGPGDIFMQLYSLTGNPKWGEMSKGLHDATLKMALATGDANTAMDRMWNNRFDSFSNHDVRIFTPKSVDADDVAAKLQAYRASLPPELAAFRDGVWKNSDDGSGFVLVLPHGGQAMAVDGKVRVIGYDELEDIKGLSPSPYGVEGYYGE